MLLLENRFEVGDIVYYYSAWRGINKRKVTAVRITFDGEKQESEYKLSEERLSLLSCHMDTWISENEIFTSKEDFISRIKEMDFPE